LERIDARFMQQPVIANARFLAIQERPEVLRPSVCGVRYPKLFRKFLERQEIGDESFGAGRRSEIESSRGTAAQADQGGQAVLVKALRGFYEMGLS